MSKRPLDQESELFAARKKRRVEETFPHPDLSWSATTSRTLSHNDYSVGWICALPLEMTAAKAMLDQIHATLVTPSYDSNAYTLGNICGHNVVMACLPAGVYGTTSAATVASQMLSSFTSINTRFMVGIGGGVPSNEHDIRLGDVVVSTPSPQCAAVVQYDYGKTLASRSYQVLAVFRVATV